VLVEGKKRRAVSVGGKDKMGSGDSGPKAGQNGVRTKNNLGKLTNGLEGEGCKTRMKSGTKNIKGKEPKGKLWGCKRERRQYRWGRGMGGYTQAQEFLRGIVKVKGGGRSGV